MRNSEDMAAYLKDDYVISPFEIFSFIKILIKIFLYLWFLCRIIKKPKIKIY